MTGLDRKIAIGASVLMTLSVAVNMVAFQGKGAATGTGQGSAIETGGLPSRGGWVEGPGIGLGPVSPPAAVPPLPGPTDPPAMAPKEDVNTAELTRGIQRELDARGYDVGQPDGVAGLVTRAAIFAYEYDNGLVLTGKPSEPLLSQIVLGSSSLEQNNARPGKTISPDGEALVRDVKQKLNALGYQTGATGGALTPELARAIRDFETEQKLKLSGRISGPMMSRLIRLQGQAKAHRAAPSRSAAR
jgi:peptidoglycan hydrolase-like protein with peptidoglycan-binding domain